MNRNYNSLYIDVYRKRLDNYYFTILKCRKCGCNVMGVRNAKLSGRNRHTRGGRL